MDVSGFDWDDGNWDKCRKRDVKLTEIEAVFANQPLVSPDITHSTRETRFIAIGRTGSGRSVFVAFALRSIGGATLIRPISARYMHQKKIDHFDQAIAGADKRR